MELKITGSLINVFIALACLIFAGCGRTDSAGEPGAGSDISGEYSSICVQGDNVFVSYHDKKNKDLIFSRSTDGGNIWRAEDIRTVDSDGDVGADTSVAAVGNSVYISYYDGSNQQLKFAHSSDGGDTWIRKDIRTVDPERGTGTFNSIAVSGNRVYISYTNKKENELRFAASADNGKTWEPADIRLVDGSAVSKGGRYTSIASEGSNIYISYNGAYHGKGMGKSLKVAKSTDRGRTWNPANIKVVEGPECSLGLYSSLAVKNGNVYIIYAGKRELKAAVSRDQGGTWKPEDIRVIDSSEQPGVITCVSLDIDGNNLFVSYVKEDYLKFAKSIDSALTWECLNVKKIIDLGKVNVRFYRGLSTSIAVSKENIYISYYDDNKGKLGIARSKDRGINWGR